MGAAWAAPWPESNREAAAGPLSDETPHQSEEAARWRPLQALALVEWL